MNSNQVTESSQNPTASSQNPTDLQPQYKLQFLCSLIPRPFDGKRSEFNEFVTNCENAMILAHDSQKHPLLVFIISKLTGNVRSQLQGKKYDKWADLKTLLNSLYQDKKHYIQLMEELNTLKQGIHESVASFHERIDKLVTRLLNTMSYKNENEQLGKIETIKELALSRFIHHSLPDISRFLRSQNLETISDALSKATLEERALKISKDEFKSKQNPIFCNFCKRSGHLTKNCFKKPKQRDPNILVNQATSTRNNQTFNNSSNNNYHDKFCNYCKKRGHLISECRKREYNNRQKAFNQNQSNPSHNSSHSNPSQVNLNLQLPQISAESVEMDILEA